MKLSFAFQWQRTQWTKETKVVLLDDNARSYTARVTQEKL